VSIWTGIRFVKAVAARGQHGDDQQRGVSRADYLQDKDDIADYECEVSVAEERGVLLGGKWRDRKATT
jgi:hypothetical protein